MGYQWDPEKAKNNFRKHGVHFADAVGVFEDPAGLWMEEQEDDGEQRFVAVGMDLLGNIITVVYTHRGNDIRIISARKASKKERLAYEKRI